MKSDDELLEEIIVRLRTMPVPEMPTLGRARRAAKTRGWILYGIGASALAASFVGFLLWHTHGLQKSDPRLPEVVKQPRTDTSESAVIVRAVDITEPLAQLEENLDSFDAEISKLRRKAALLDARRMADELLTMH